jgi:hypothetical protein
MYLYQETKTTHEERSSMASGESFEQPKIVYEQNLRSHCEVAALILCNLPSTSPSRHHVKAAIRHASHQVSAVRGGNNKIKAQFMSLGAELQMGSLKFDGLIAEHLVPIKVIASKVLHLPTESISWERIRDIVVRYSAMALVTIEEDLHLKSLGLLSSMPANWDGENRLARYEVANIALKENTFSALKKAR